MDFPSKILENAVNEISQLPGIGKRTALRLALHILKQPENQIDTLADAIKNLRKTINFWWGIKIAKFSSRVLFQKYLL